MTDVDTIARQALNGEITIEKASKQLWEIIFLNRKVFSLASFTEDELQDFLIKFHESLPRTITSYEEESGSFFNYLYSQINNSARSFRRQQLRKSAGQDSCESCNIIENENIEDRYNSGSYIPEHSFTELKILVDSLPKSTYRKITCHRNNPFYQIFQQNTIRRETVLILALKSCYHITDEMTEKVSILTGYDRAKLDYLIDEARKTLAPKLRRRLVYSHSRDNAFYFHRKYFLEKMRINVHSPIAVFMAQKYVRHTRNWENAIKKLNSSICSLVPSTKTVANLLEMDVRHAEYLLRHLESNMDKIKLKWYPLQHENISGHRQS